MNDMDKKDRKAKTENLNEELKQASAELSKTFSECATEVYAAVKTVRDDFTTALNRVSWDAKNREAVKARWSALNRFCHAFETFHAAAVAVAAAREENASRAT